MHKKLKQLQEENEKCIEKYKLNQIITVLNDCTYKIKPSQHSDITIVDGTTKNK